MAIPANAHRINLPISFFKMWVFTGAKKYNTHNKKAVTPTLIKFKPNGFKKLPLSRYFTAVKLRAKNILVASNATCAFVFVVTISS